MVYLDGKPGRTAVINGKKFLFFSGYNYLGIDKVPEFLQLLQEGLERYGWLFPSSRISNTRLAIFEECEALLSEITGSEETVLVSSGFNAGRLATHFNVNDIMNAPDSHPSINRNAAANSDFKEWGNWFVQTTNANPADHSIFASDSLNPIKATLNDFTFLKHTKKRVSGIIDDSHGIGMTGEQGKGVASIVPALTNLDYIFTYSLSKAFGIAGGAVSCSKERAALIRTLPDYTAVTPPAPAQLYAFLKAQHIYAIQREKLFNNISYLGECIKDILGIKFNPDYPIVLLPEAFDEKVLFDNNIIISSFSYPDPSSAKVNRLVLNALHTKEDLEFIAECLHKAILD
ncbi:MAG TPA: aminotransferase class I/II-fold pyridoxal phosphate-dependent enzyme [Sphingobacteriaceae bacterium]|nr:aminotransferase class I/II-fold pyridoxal phosphate-dependent enzyme [Sphingobacteriaceae bacterium]